MKVSSYLLLSLLLSVAAAQDLSSKTRYYTNGLTDAFHLVDVITPVSHTYAPYSDTSLCIASACDTPSALTAYQISYENQGTTLACFCDNAVFDISYMADNVGRVPYPLRRTVLSYTAASIGQGQGAYAAAAHIAFFDEGENTEVFIHESAHSFDGSYNPGLSSSSVYQNDITQDACVPDDYAASNRVEDFAQLTVTWTYYVLTNTATPNCLSNSINYLSTVLSRQSILATFSNNPSTSAPSTSSPSTSSPVTSAPVTTPPTPSSCTIGVSQSLTNSWVSNGQQFSQYNVVFSNNGASATPIVVSFANPLSQVWNLDQHKDGLFHLPSYQSTIAAGAQYTAGYVAQGSSPVSIAVITPAECNPYTNPSSSAPVTSAPVTSAPVTSAPVTSAPVTSAPVTSAPVTSAPVTSAPSCVIEILQTKTNTWTSNGITYSQFTVVYSNHGSTASSPVVQVSGGVVSQSWNIVLNSGKFTLPSYQATIAPGAQFTWGYISETSSALSLALSC